MGFFDFLADVDAGRYDDNPVRRMNLRHERIIEPVRDRLEGARVLDLAAHDGRWSYAAAQAGAREAVGIEGRADLVADYKTFPETPWKDRASLMVGDIVAGMRGLAATGERFDVVLCLGIYYHIMNHYDVLLAIRDLGPELVVMDTTLHHGQGAAIHLASEVTDNRLNAVAQFDGQEWTPAGTPTVKAMEVMADSVGYDLSTWINWPRRLTDDPCVADYFRDRRRRHTFHLTRR